MDRSIKTVRCYWSNQSSVKAGQGPSTSSGRVVERPETPQPNQDRVVCRADVSKANQTTTHYCIAWYAAATKNKRRRETCKAGMTTCRKFNSTAVQIQSRETRSSSWTKTLLQYFSSRNLGSHTHGTKEALVCRPEEPPQLLPLGLLTNRKCGGSTSRSRPLLQVGIPRTCI